METRRIGSCEVSAVGLGCNNFGMRIDEAQAKLVVDAALEVGITHFDTADIYGGTKSEEYLGRALGTRRSQVVVATKFGMEVDPGRKGAAPDYVRRACEDSLRRLGTDHLDIYWLHQPDPQVPVADTLGALGALVAAGKVRELGCSNFSPAQLREARAEAMRLGLAGFAAVQNEYSLVHREPELPEAPEGHAAGEPYPNDGMSKRGVLAACSELGMAFVPYFPLASGLLSGKYRAGQPAPEGSRLATSQRAGRFLNEANLALVERLMAWLEVRATAQRRDGTERPEALPADVAALLPDAAAPPAPDRAWTLLDLSIAWLLGQPQVASVIAGATTPEQVRANAAASDWRMNHSELATIAQLAAGEPASAP